MRTLAAGAVVAAVLSLAPGAGAATAAPTPARAGVEMGAHPQDAPFNVTDQITDRAGVLGDVTALQADLDELRSQHGLQLFVVYVDGFDGASGETWTQQTFAQSGMGGDDVLMAVAVKDRRYGTYTPASRA